MRDVRAKDGRHQRSATHGEIGSRMVAERRLEIESVEQAAAPIWTMPLCYVMYIATHFTFWGHKACTASPSSATGQMLSEQSWHTLSGPEAACSLGRYGIRISGLSIVVDSATTLAGRNLPTPRYNILKASTGWGTLQSSVQQLQDLGYARAELTRDDWILK